MRARTLLVALTLSVAVPAFAADARKPGADPKTVSHDGTTALHRAVEANDVPAAAALIKRGASVKAANHYGVTPIALAAINGNPAMMQLLLEAGADASAVSMQGEPVLMTAARTGNPDVVKMLLAHGADPNAREAWQQQTALMWAAADDHADVVRLLLDAGADPAAADRVFELHELKPKDGGTPKAVTSKGGMTALQYAARQGAIQAVRTMAEKGVDLDQQDPDGVTPLLYAVLNGHTDTAALLLEKGADPNVADAFGRTVLYGAIDLNRWEMIAPRPAPKTNDRMQPLELARLAIAKGAQVNSQIVATLPPRSTQGNNDTTPVGATPLYRAAKSSDVNAITLLLGAGADPSLPTKDGVTPLMVAAGVDWKFDKSLGTEDESIASIRLLMAAGATVNARDAKHDTALHGAADRGAAGIVTFLADNGARLDVKDTSNRTPLDVAMGVPPVGGRGPLDYREKSSDPKSAAVLRELMAAKGIAIEPYAAPPQPDKAPTAQ